MIPTRQLPLTVRTRPARIARMLGPEVDALGARISTTRAACPAPTTPGRRLYRGVRTPATTIEVPPVAIRASRHHCKGGIGGRTAW